jgi:hypothetical protein
MARIWGTGREQASGVARELALLPGLASTTRRAYPKGPPMHRYLVPALVLALAGCGQDKQPKTADEVISEAGKLDRPRAGQYETRVEMLNFSVPGIPPQQAEQLKTMMSRVNAQANSYCLTEEEAKKGFEDSIRKMTEGGGSMKCAFDRFAVNGGKLDAALKCTGPQGLTSAIAIDGTASSESSAMHMTMDQSAAMIPGGKMQMEMRMNSRRTGDCQS